MARLLSDAIHKDVVDIQRLDADNGQMAVWLSGLAATFLALAVANTERIRLLVGGPSYHAMIFLLSTTVLAGLLSRALSLSTSRKIGPLGLDVSMYMAGYALGSHSPQPSTLSEHWDEAEIVFRLRREFGIDYDWLISFKCSVEACREAYLAQWRIWKEFEESGIVHLATVVGAYRGLTETQARVVFDPSKTYDLEAARRRARSIHIVRGITIILIWITAGSFALAMSLVASRLWFAV